MYYLWCILYICIYTKLNGAIEPSMSVFVTGTLPLGGLCTCNVWSIFRKNSSSDLHSRLKTRKVLGVGVEDDGTIHFSKVSCTSIHQQIRRIKQESFHFCEGYRTKTWTYTKYLFHFLIFMFLFKFNLNFNFHTLSVIHLIDCGQTLPRWAGK